MVDPLFYVDDTLIGGVGASLGVKIDSLKSTATFVELTQRFYDDGQKHTLVDLSQSLHLSQNFQLQLRYRFKGKLKGERRDTKRYILQTNYYF